MNKDKLEIYVGALKALLSKSFASILSYVMTIVVARQLNIELSGVFFYSVMLLTVFSALIRFGCENVILKYTALCISEGNKEKLNGIILFIIKRIFLIFIVGFSVISLVIFLLHETNQISKEMAIHSGLICLSILPLSLCQFFSYIFQGLKRVLSSNFYYSGALPFSVLLLFYLFNPNNIMAIGFLLLSASSVAFLMSTMAMFRFGFKLKEKVISEQTKSKSLSDSYSMYLVVILNIVITWSSQFIVGILGTSEDVSIFAVSQRTAMLLGFLIMAVNSITAPKFAIFYKNGDMEGIKSTLFSSVRFVSLIASPVIIFIFVFPDVIMSLFGEIYTEYSSVFLLLCIGQLFNLFTGTVGQLLNMSGNQKYVKRSFQLSALINILLCLLLFPLFGLYGAAIAFTAAFSIQNIISAYYVNKLFGINILKALKFGHD
jgi:O-antigen/teichoic acid export membrane protein